jgi:hypothetical protein
MNFRCVVLVLAVVSFSARLLAADEPEPKSRMKDVLKAQAAEAAKKKPTGPTAAPITPTAQAQAAATKSDPQTPVPAPSSMPATPAPTAAKDASPATPSAASEQPATVLPKVEVKKDRVTVLDHNLAMQDKEIAREKKNTTPTELDKALNDSKVSKALSIFGGQSGDYRAGISKERVQMMEEEKQVMEAIAHAKTKEEKAELQKELDQLKELRRDLEKSLR